MNKFRTWWESILPFVGGMFEGWLAATVKLYLVLGGWLDMGLNWARGVTRWTNSKKRGTWIVGYLGFMKNVGMSKGEWIPQPREKLVALVEKEGHQGWWKKSK
jgi:hypothetical protein